MHKKESGFTLIELLIVIAIIGLLASIVLTNLQSARRKGAEAADLQNVKQIKNALDLYADDNNGNYPLPAGSTCVLYPNTATPPCWTTLSTQLQPYITNMPLSIKAIDLKFIEYLNSGIITFNVQGVPQNCIEIGPKGYYLATGFVNPVSGITDNYPVANTYSLFGGRSVLGVWNGSACQ